MEQPDSLSLAQLRDANAQRQVEWTGDNPPDLAFRGVELGGETGEAQNVIKKIIRERHGWRGSRATLDDLGDELADVVICADLTAMTEGIDLAAAVRRKFNATSDKVGLQTRLEAATQAVPVSHRYVCGFLFYKTGSVMNVALIRKNRPAWQFGMHNGIGGKIEPGETPEQAMRREFEEEAGVDIETWRPLAVLRGPDFEVHFFFEHATPKQAAGVAQSTDEPVDWFDVLMITDELRVVDNLRVLIPLALDTSGIAKPLMLTDERASSLSGRAARERVA